MLNSKKILKKKIIARIINDDILTNYMLERINGFLIFLLKIKDKVWGVILLVVGCPGVLSNGNNLRGLAPIFWYVI